MDESGSRSLREVIDALNPVLRGRGNYFSVGNSSRQFQKMDPPNQGEAGVPDGDISSFEPKGSTIFQG
nr:hypothetical protein [Desulfobacterales bacterium]